LIFDQAWPSHLLSPAVVLSEAQDLIKSAFEAEKALATASQPYYPEEIF